VAVRDDGELLGVIAMRKDAGDAMTPPEQALTEDVARQAALLLRNARLIEELRASRERIVAAQDDERRRLERDIHDGAQQQLVTLSLATRLAQSGLGPDAPQALTDLLERAVDESKQALSELRELARGIHPRILTERGLPAAIRSLAERAPVPVTVEAAEGERLPEPIEATAYFAVSEALQNIAKYAQASTAEVRTFRENGTLVVRVSDDGVGGADPSKGSGLRGLLDRVDAVGGRLDVHSPDGEGTRVTISLPVAERSPALAGAG
jgi:signal transduction histidine kinase